MNKKVLGGGGHLSPHNHSYLCHVLVEAHQEIVLLWKEKHKVVWFCWCYYMMWGCCLNYYIIKAAAAVILLKHTGKFAKLNMLIYCTVEPPRNGNIGNISYCPLFRITIQLQIFVVQYFHNLTSDHKKFSSQKLKNCEMVGVATCCAAQVAKWAASKIRTCRHSAYWYWWTYELNWSATKKFSVRLLLGVTAGRHTSE